MRHADEHLTCVFLRLILSLILFFLYVLLSSVWICILYCLLYTLYSVDQKWSVYEPWILDLPGASKTLTEGLRSMRPSSRRKS